MPGLNQCWKGVISFANICTLILIEKIYILKLYKISPYMDQNDAKQSRFNKMNVSIQFILV